MTPLDSLERGQWIAICKDRFRKLPASFTGEPAEIKAISLPFLLVWLPRLKHSDTIDTRRYDVVLLDKRYVREILRLPPNPTDMTSVEEDDCNCPICGSLREHIVVCDECGFNEQM